MTRSRDNIHARGSATLRYLLFVFYSRQVNECVHKGQRPMAVRIDTSTPRVNLIGFPSGDLVYQVGQSALMDTTQLPRSWPASQLVRYVIRSVTSPHRSWLY